MAAKGGAGRYGVVAVSSGADRRGPLPGAAASVAARWLVISPGGMLGTDLDGPIRRLAAE